MTTSSWSHGCLAHVEGVARGGSELVARVRGCSHLGLKVIQPLNHCESGCYYHNPRQSLPSHSCHSLQVRSFSLSPRDGRVTKSKCQPVLSDPFDGELSLWGAMPNKAFCRGLPRRDCSSSFTSSPPPLHRVGCEVGLQEHISSPPF